MVMSKTATLSTIIDARVKEAITLYCKERGIKLRHLIEQALVEQIEDEIDLEAYRTRQTEERVSLEEVLARSRKKKS
jgi:antitoxin component of RelBE/YafQ-DinJ toxin-antitoxin module